MTGTPTADTLRRELAGNTPLLLDDPGTAWVVTEGSAYVFAVHTRDGAAVGAREFVAQVATGEPLVGMPSGPTWTGADTEEVALLAVGRPGTVLTPATDAAGTVPVEVVTAWSRVLTAGLGAPAPRDAVVVPPGSSTDTAEGLGYRGEAAVLWVRVEGGALELAGVPGAVVDGSTGPVPLTSSTWFRATGPGRVVTGRPPGPADGADDPGDTDERVALADVAAYHRVVLGALTHAVTDRTTARTTRTRTRSDADAASLDAGLRDLVAFFDHGGTPDQEEGPAATTDPLLRACRLVGDSLGVRVEAPPSWLSGSRDHLAAIARASRLRDREVLLDDGWWRSASGPLLAFRAEGGAPVALVPVRRRRAYELVDPVTGSRTRVTAAVAATLAPHARSFYRPFPDRPLGAWDLVRFGTRRGGGDIATIVVMGLLGGLLALVVPLASDVLFTRFIPDRDLGGVAQIAVAMLASVAATTAFQVVRAIAVARLGARMDEQLEAAVWDRLLGLPATFFRQYSSGDLALRATSISVMRRVLSAVVTTAILGSVFSVFSFGLLFVYDVRLALLVTLLLAGAMAVGVVSFVVQVRDRRTAFEVRGHQTGLVFEMLNGIAKLRVSGSEARAFAVWARLVGAATPRRAQLAGVVLNVLFAALPLLALVIVFPLTAGADPPMSAGTFVAFNTALSQVIAAVIGLGSAFTGVAQILPLFERVKPILDALPETDEAKADPGELVGEIDVEDVSFRYSDDGPMVLSNVSFHAKPGEFVALVGPSGSGKSTILRLLLGFEKPLGGSIYLDAQDLSTLDLPAVRRQMGVVLQSGQLSPGTIFTSIVGTSPFTLDEAWEAAAGAGLDEDIRRMPMGMQTIIMEGGAGLSGGQRQRLLIARAIVAKPRILLFDEATSALDNRTQAVVTESLSRLNTTRIVIAHRLSTVIRADQIHVVEAGRIVESGTYEELMGRGGAFAALASRQLS